MIASLRLRMTDPKPSEISGSGASRSLSVSDWIDTSNYKFWISLLIKFWSIIEHSRLTLKAQAMSITEKHNRFKKKHNLSRPNCGLCIMLYL